MPSIKTNECEFLVVGCQSKEECKRLARRGTICPISSEPQPCCVLPPVNACDVQNIGVIMPILFRSRLLDSRSIGFVGVQSHDGMQGAIL